jgi:hypothetical protein
VGKEGSNIIICYSIKAVMYDYCNILKIIKS